MSELETILMLIAILVFALIGLRVLFRIDWTPGRYKIVAHPAATADITTRVSSGWMTIEGGEIRIQGENDFTIPVASLRSVELTKLHRIGTLIRIFHDQGAMLVSVVTFSIAGQFASINSFKTRRLAQHLQSLILEPAPSAATSPIVS